MIASPNYLITSANVMWPGSVHDSRIFENSQIKNVLQNANHAHVLGDSGYPLKTYLLTPFGNPHTAAEIRYNNAQSRTRMRVECTFGILKRRFACLDSKLRTQLQTTIATIISCFVLHNYCIIHNDLWEIDEVNIPQEILHVPRNLRGALQGLAKRQSILRNIFM